MKILEFLLAISAAAAAALVGGLFGLIKWLVGRKKNRKPEEPGSNVAAGAGSSVATDGATSAPEISGVVVDRSPGARVYVGAQPPPPQTVEEPDKTAPQSGYPEKFHWQGRPASLENHFVGRQADLDRVVDTVGESGVVVISGGAGTGKTRLAVEFTYESETGGFWTSAGATAEQTLTGLAPKLEINTAGMNDEDIAMHVRRAIADSPNGLVWVIDNLPEFAQVNELQASVANLTLLITTRDSRSYLLPPTAEFLSLTFLEPEAAVELLCSQGADDSDRAVFNEIADFVGFLPLALEMLAVRLGEPLADALSVLTELKEAPNPLSVGAFEDAAGQVLGKLEGVYSAITGTLNSLSSEARIAISPLGYLADQPIPLPLASALTGLDRDGLGVLLVQCARQSILTESQERLVIHALTAVGIATTNDGEVLSKAIGLATHRLIEINTDDPLAMRAEVFHHESLLIHVNKEMPAEDAVLVDFVSNLGIGFNVIGRREEALKLFERALEIAARVHGPEGRRTLSCKGNLAVAYEQLERTEESLKLNEEILEAWVKELGPEHPDTLSSKSNIAIGYSTFGRTEEAVKLDEEILEARVRVLGPEHQDTLTSRHNLSVGYRALGRMEESVMLIEETLEARKRIFGLEHPDTINILDNLAIGYGELGRMEAAVKLNEETLELRVRVFGREHPSTMFTRNNLIILYRVSGKDADAEALEADKRFSTDEDA